MKRIFYIFYKGVEIKSDGEKCFFFLIFLRSFCEVDIIFYMFDRIYQGNFVGLGFLWDDVI